MPKKQKKSVQKKVEETLPKKQKKSVQKKVEETFSKSVTYNAGQYTATIYTKQKVIVGKIIGYGSGQFPHLTVFGKTLAGDEKIYTIPVEAINLIEGEADEFMRSAVVKKSGQE
jgi:hypothetical protein